MSKSLGNTFELRAALETYGAYVLRYYFVSVHYRAPIQFHEDALLSAKNSLEKFHELWKTLDEYKGNGEIDCTELIEQTKKKYEEAMDDDFDTSRALAALFSLLKEVNILLHETHVSRQGCDAIKKFLVTIDAVLGCIVPEQEVVPEHVATLVHQRETLRSQKKFTEADTVRKTIITLGYTVKDTQEGPYIRKL